MFLHKIFTINGRFEERKEEGILYKQPSTRQPKMYETFITIRNELRNFR